MPLFVGIAGPSCAGKTTLALRLLERLPSQCSLMQLDWYYNDLSALGEEERAATNFDHPEALDWERFFEDFMLLHGGQAIDAPVYDFVHHARTQETQPVEPRPVVLVEGLHVLWQPALRAMLDFRVYVDAPQVTCLSRRVKRDVAERGRTQAYAARQYKQHTNPMYLDFVAPSREFAELVIDGSQAFDAEVASLAARLL